MRGRIGVLVMVIVFVLLAAAHPGLIPAQTLSLDYSTYLGGGGGDEGYAIAVDTSGCAYVAGPTNSDNFPTSNPYQASKDLSSDVFVSKLSSTGSALLYSSYLGGSSGDNGEGIYVEDGLAYVTGYTLSDNFPTANPYQSSKDLSTDVFVSKLSSTGSALLYSTYLGGIGNDGGEGISVEDSLAYVTGYTSWSDFPTLNPYQSSHGGGDDVFVSKLSSTGSALLYSTYLGGSGYDYGKGISVEDGLAYVAGYATSANFPTSNPYQSSLGGGNDVIVSKLSSTGSALLYSTYLGGSSGDCGEGISVENGLAYVVGYTFSNNFPTSNPYQASQGGEYDVFVSNLSSTGSALLHSTYLGGSAWDMGYGISIENGRAYVAGYTSSVNFPTSNPYQASSGGDKDAFVSRLNFIPLEPTATPSPTPEPTATPSPTPEPSATPSLTPAPTSSSIPTPATTPTAMPPATPSATPTCGPPVPLELQAYRSSDYDGDGTSEIAIFRPSSGLWAIRGLTRFTFGSAASRIVSADYDGDGTAEAAVFNPASALWAIRNLSRIYYGAAGDLPAPGDYDGSGTVVPGVFRETSGLWSVRGGVRTYFGGAADWPVPSDFDGDGDDDIAVYRPDAGGSGFSLFAVRNGERDYYGRPGDWPVVMDYDGDGTVDMGIFRANTNAVWAVRDVTRIYYGRCVDWPASADYDGDGLADLGIFRDSAALWAVRGVTRAYYGTDGDVPVTR